MLPEEAGEEEREVLYEGLILIGAHIEGLRHVCIGQDHRRRRPTNANRDGGCDLREEGLEVRVVCGANVAGERLVDGADVERADLGEASEDVVPEGGLRVERGGRVGRKG